MHNRLYIFLYVGLKKLIFFGGAKAPHVEAPPLRGLVNGVGWLVR